MAETGEGDTAPNPADTSCHEAPHQRFTIRGTLNETYTGCRERHLWWGGREDFAPIGGGERMEGGEHAGIDEGDPCTTNDDGDGM
jgi:hypothetical protein